MSLIAGDIKYHFYDMTLPYHKVIQKLLHVICALSPKDAIQAQCMAPVATYSTE